MKIYKIITKIDTVYYIAAKSGASALKALEDFAKSLDKRAEVKTLQVLEGTFLIDIPWDKI